MLKPARKTLGKHPLSRKRSNLPSTNGIVWIILVLVVLIICGLLGGAIFVITSTDDAVKASSHTENEQLPQKQRERKQQLLRPAAAGSEGKHFNGMNAQSAKQEFAQASHASLQAIRDEFQRRYGPYAETIRAKGISHFGGSEAVAHRILRAASAPTNVLLHKKKPVFDMAFAGYSVTVGRGNFFQQSYPFILRDILAPAFREIFELDLTVRNAAIGGIPSFPYGFCFSHFLGPSPDVISWDYSMNENGKDNTAVLESYIRHSQHQLGHRVANEQPPVLFISLDTHKARCDLLSKYTQQGLLPSAMCVGRADDIFQVKDLAQQASNLPPGLQDWGEFGAPANCPGRSSWHPKKKEHEMIAWMLALQFVDILEQAVHITQTDIDWIKKYASNSRELAPIPVFPKPLSQQLPHNPDPAISNLLYGHSNANGQYEMHHISCRTSFLPAHDTENVLPRIVVSGLSDQHTADTIMQERSDKDYRGHWVLDVSTIERQTKVKVEQCGGLGYEDMKIALYGAAESGPLRLWLPVEPHTVAQHEGDHPSDHDGAVLLDASHWLDGLVLCEANEKRSSDACQLHRDLELTVGGISNPVVQVIAGVGEYLKRPTCVHVTIPPDAQMVALSELTSLGSPAAVLSDEIRQRLSHGLSSGDNAIGLVLDVKPSSRVTRKGGACCLSHVAWELH